MSDHLTMINIFNDVKSSLRPFNDDLLINQRKKQVNSCIDAIATVYKEASKLFNNSVEYIGYNILTPEEQLEYELSTKNKYAFYNIKKSEWNLVKYNFRFNYQDKEPDNFNVYLYLPYLVDNYIIINNTRYGIQGALTDKVFSKNGEMIIVKLLKSPIPFFTKLYSIVSKSSNKLYQIELPIVRIHNNSKRIKNHTTIFTYFICKYGFNEALSIFNLSQKDIEIINYTKVYDPEYEYFQIEKRKFPKLLKVRIEPFNTNIRTRSIVASIIKTLSIMKYLPPIEEFYRSPDIWYIFLGKIIYGVKLEKAKAYNNIVKHLESLETYLDPISIKRYESFGLTNITSIYDLFKFMIDNINEINIKYTKNDLLLKRIDYFDQAIIDVIVKKLFRRIYNYKNRNSQYKLKEISRTFKLKVDLIKDLWMIQNVSTSINNYNSSMLFNYLSKLVKPASKSNNGSKKAKDSISKLSSMKFNLTEILAFSPFCFSTSNPLNSGSVNPFSETNEYGGFKSTEFYESLIEKGYKKYFK